MIPPLPGGEGRGEGERKKLTSRILTGCLIFSQLLSQGGCDEPKAGRARHSVRADRWRVQRRARSDAPYLP